MAEAKAQRFQLESGSQLWFLSSSLPGNRRRCKGDFLSVSTCWLSVVAALTHVLQGPSEV